MKNLLFNLKHLRQKIGTGVILFIGVCWPFIIEAAPKAELWARWQRHNPQDTQLVDHRLWQTFLTQYLQTSHPSGIHRMNYKAVTPQDRQLLNNYLKMLQSLPISSYNSKEQKAYWINLYNALTVQVILNHYPVTSIRDINISPGLFSRGPWDAKLAQVEGETLSLNDIEHRILRPLWKDNRIHYAANCASLGCPNLAPVPYTAENMEQLLEQGAKEYVNHPRGAVFQKETLHVSTIYLWYQDDFGGSTQGLIQHLRHYATGALAHQLQSEPEALEGDYDWQLNAP